MKLQKLVSSRDALSKLSKGLLPIDIAWDLKKLINAVNPELTSYEEIRRAKIIELGTESGEGEAKTIVVKPENIAAFTEQINQLNEKEIEIPPLQIKIKELIDLKDQNGKKIEISTADLMVLDWLIVE